MSFWTVLGLERTRDARTIRRAYARLLKVTQPEDDPEGFKTLRESYEAALAYAEHGFAWTGGDDPLEFDDGDDEPPPDSPAPDDLTPDDDLDDLKAKVLALRDADPASEPERLEQAFADIAASPQLESLDARDRFERWLTWILVAGGPAGDRLVPAAIAAMGWREHGGGDLADTIDQLFAGQRAVSFLKDLRMPRHPFHAGYQALIGAPPASSLVWFFRASPLAAIRDVMEGLEEHPHARAAFDHLDAWEDWLARPRLSLTAMWAALIAAPILGALWWLLNPDSGLGGFVLGGLVGGLGALALGVLHFLAVLWPRRLWREQWSWRQPEWVGTGWVAGAIGLLLAAMLMTPSLPGMIFQGVVGLAVAYWCALTGDIDRRESGQPWPVRLAMANAYFVIWLGALIVFAPEVVAPLLPALVAGAICAIMGSFTLAWLWAGRLGPIGRMVGAVLLLVACFMAIALLANVTATPALAGPGVMLTALAVMASRVLADELGEGARTARHYLCWFGLLGLGQVVLAQGGGPPLALQIVTAWMLIGPVIVGFATLAAAFDETRGR